MLKKTFRPVGTEVLEQVGARIFFVSSLSKRIMRTR